MTPIQRYPNDSSYMLVEISQKKWVFINELFSVENVYPVPTRTPVYTCILILFFFIKKKYPRSFPVLFFQLFQSGQKSNPLRNVAIIGNVPNCYKSLCQNKLLLHVLLLLQNKQNCYLCQIVIRVQVLTVARQWSQWCQKCHKYYYSHPNSDSKILPSSTRTPSFMKNMFV